MRWRCYHRPHRVARSGAAPVARCRACCTAARCRAAELLDAVGWPASAQSSMAKLSVAELMQAVAAVCRGRAGPRRPVGGGDRDVAGSRRGLSARIGGDDHLRRCGRDPTRRDRPPGAGAPAAMTLPPAHSPPLPRPQGIRVLEYAQYVAGPFAGMLLADLGADVVKIVCRMGHAWRRYEPFAAGESRYFYALNRNKRSVVLDLKTDEGRLASRALIRSADAVLHNLPPERARAFELDRQLGLDRQPGRRLVLCLGAGQRRTGGVPDRLRPRRPGPVRAAVGQRAGLRRGPSAGGWDRHGGFHRRPAGGGRRARRSCGPRAFGGPYRPLSPWRSRCSARPWRFRRKGSFPSVQTIDPEVRRDVASLRLTAPPARSGTPRPGPACRRRAGAVLPLLFRRSRWVRGGRLSA